MAIFEQLKLKHIWNGFLIKYTVFQYFGGGGGGIIFFTFEVVIRFFFLYVGLD